MTPADKPGLTHVDSRGDARMVNVAAKDTTARRAVARSRVEAHPDTIALLAAGGGPKGDVFAVARIAGILAAKKTSDLIPLCHGLSLDHVDIHFDVKPDHIEIIASCVVQGRTGVEMEAMMAASIAGLTIYDMGKAVDRLMRVGPVELVSKEGGKSGAWHRDGDEGATGPR